MQTLIFVIFDSNTIIFDSKPSLLELLGDFGVAVNKSAASAAFLDYVKFRAVIKSAAKPRAFARVPLAVSC